MALKCLGPWSNRAKILNMNAIVIGLWIPNPSKKKSNASMKQGWKMVGERFPTYLEGCSFLETLILFSSRSFDRAQRASAR